MKHAHPRARALAHTHKHKVGGKRPKQKLVKNGVAGDVARGGTKNEKSLRETED